MRKPKLFFINSICESYTNTFSALSDSTSTIANNGSCTRTLWADFGQCGYSQTVNIGWYGSLIILSNMTQ